MLMTAVCACALYSAIAATFFVAHVVYALSSRCGSDVMSSRSLCFNRMRFNGECNDATRFCNCDNDIIINALVWCAFVALFAAPAAADASGETVLCCTRPRQKMRTLL